MKAALWCAHGLFAPKAYLTGGVVGFGSYPWFTPEGFGVHLVARSANAAALDKAIADIAELVRSRGGEPEEVSDSN